MRHLGGPSDLDSCRSGVRKGWWPCVLAIHCSPRIQNWDVETAVTPPVVRSLLICDKSRSTTSLLVTRGVAIYKITDHNGVLALDFDHALVCTKLATYFRWNLKCTTQNRIDNDKPPDPMHLLISRNALAEGLELSPPNNIDENRWLVKNALHTVV